MKYILNIILVVLVSFLTTKFFITKSEKKESVYDRVINSGTLRCGYGLWPKLVDKDPNTGKLSGVYVDFITELARNLDLKVLWTEEISWGDIASSLNSDRMDAFCAGAWTNTIRGKYVDFTIPPYYSTVYPYARIDDSRFDVGLDSVNSPDVTISVIEGESSQVVATADFPKAKLLVMPKITEGAQNILNVVTKKADIVLGDPTLVEAYMKNNPNQIRRIKAEYPTRVFGNAIAVKKGEFALKSMLDNAIEQMIWTGSTDKIIRKHEEVEGTFARPILPFKK